MRHRAQVTFTCSCTWSRTAESLDHVDAEQHGVNRFVDDEYSRDLTNAKLTVRMRGTWTLRAPLCNNQGRCRNPTSAALSFCSSCRRRSRVHREQPPTPFCRDSLSRSRQIGPCRPSSSLPTPTMDVSGARHDMTDVTATRDSAEVLSRWNLESLVLFPLEYVVPIMGRWKTSTINGPPHKGGATEDPDTVSTLPKGLGMLIRFRSNTGTGTAPFALRPPSRAHPAYGSRRAACRVDAACPRRYLQDSRHITQWTEVPMPAPASSPVFPHLAIGRRRAASPAWSTRNRWGPSLWR